jgi:hypothetical protein
MKTVEPGQQIVLRTNDAYDGASAVVERIWSWGDVSVTVTGEDDPICIRPTEIDGLETHVCAKCGATITALDGQRETWQDYRWDGSDSEGSIMVEHEEWLCRDSYACASRRIENAIGAIAQADAEDAALRESGYGAIRNY